MKVDDETLEEREELSTTAQESNDTEWIEKARNQYDTMIRYKTDIDYENVFRMAILDNLPKQKQ